MNLLSLGRIAEIYQEDPRVIVVSLEGIQVKPALLLNGVPYWHFDDVKRAMKEVARRLPGGEEVRGNE